MKLSIIYDELSFIRVELRDDCICAQVHRIIILNQTDINKQDFQEILDVGCNLDILTLDLLSSFMRKLVIFFEVVFFLFVVILSFRQ